jgi:hypothetical protein
MTRLVRNYFDFKKKFEKVKDRSQLFLFFLFDQRENHVAAEEFARENIEWLDNMADSAGVFIFFFVRDEEHPEASRNPSLKVATEFGILQNQLPGVVIFTIDDQEDTVKKASYLQLSPRIFSLDHKKATAVFSDLFSVITKCQNKVDNKDALIEEVQEEVMKLQRHEKLRPFFEYVTGAIVSLKKFSKDVITSAIVVYIQEKSRG